MRIQGDRLRIYPTTSNRHGFDDDDDAATKRQTLQSFLRLAVRHRRELRAVDVSCVTLTDVVVRSVASLLPDLPALESVSISACPIANDVGALWRAMLHCPNLRSVKWTTQGQSEGMIETTDVPAIACDCDQNDDFYFKSRHPFCSRCHLQSNPDPSKVVCRWTSFKLQAPITLNSMWSSMLHCVLTRGNLQELTLDGSSFEDELAVPRFVADLSKAKQLRSVRLKWCKLSESAMRDVANSLAPSVEQIDFAGNFCAMPSYERLFKGAKTLDLSHQINSIQPIGLNSLKTLRISGNQLGDDDMKKLFSKSSFSCLRKLDVSNNDIGDDGMRTLVQFVRCVPSLRELHVKGNPFGIAGVEAMLELVQYHHVGLEAVQVECSKIVRRSVQRQRRRHPTIPPHVLPHRYLYYTCSPLEFADIRRQQLLSNLDQEFRFLHKSIVYYTRLNVGGRRLLRSDDVPQGLWPRVLSRADRITEPSVVQYLLLGPALADRSEL